jgi:hypothetical protein
MKRSWVAVLSVFLLAVCLVAARTAQWTQIVIDVHSATASDTVSFDIALVVGDSQTVRVTKTPMQVKLGAEAPITVVIRRISGSAAMVVEVSRCGPYCVEQELISTSAKEVTVVTLREQGVSVGGLPSR